MKETLQRQARLESEGVQKWGTTGFGASYADAQTTLDAANRNFDRQKFSAAADGFRKANAQLDELAKSKTARYDHAMKEGGTALSALNSDKAAEQFTVALAIRPGDEAAKAALDRARVLPAVLSHMNEAFRHEKSGDLEAALKMFGDARDLDRSFQPAKKNATRVKALIEDRKYQRAVSSALAALNAGRFTSAERALADARKIRSTAPEISDIQRRIWDGRQSAQINAYRQQVAGLEKEEKWKKAIALYDKVLKIDRTVGFATQGRARAQSFSELHDQITLYLDNPARLNSPEPLDHARQVLASADAVSDAGPWLQSARDRLRDLIAKALAPKAVVLRSDGNTNVTIYRVARFGAFTERQIMLRPGKYTAVGFRNGYHDVRVEIVVSPAADRTVVEISCKEQI